MSALVMPANDQMAAIATPRFGLEARPGEIQAARGDPHGVVAVRIRAPGADQPPGPAEGAAQRLSTLYDYR
jgi:uncharacterized protein (DUF1800 family)